jgi:hypothetical protein
VAITEQSRKQLYDGLEEVLGEERATTLMEHLPPVGWADVATKQDLEHLRIATKQDLEHLRVATKSDIEAVRTDVENLRLATKKDIENLRLATKKDIENLRLATTADIEHVRTYLSAELAHTGAVTERRFVEIDRRFDSLGEIFATKHDLAQLRGDMFKLIAGQTVLLVVAMCTIASRFSG